MRWAPASTATPSACPFPDDTFDRIICSEVFEHIPDDVGAMAELTRVLRPGGVLAATVPSWLPEKICWALSAEYHAPLAPGGHVRIYTEGLLRERLDGAGLAARGIAPRPCPAPPVLVAALRGRPDQRQPPAGQGVPPPARVGHHQGTGADPHHRRVLNPVIGKSVVVYARKPGRTARPTGPQDQRRTRRVGV